MTEPTVEQALQTARRHHQAGQLPQAEVLYRQILARQPNHADALHFLGVIAHQVGRNDVAADLIRRAIALKPNWPEARYHLGVALKSSGQLDAAIAAYDQAIALSPNLPEAHNNLGIARHDNGQLVQAIAAYRQAIACRPGYPEAHYNLGKALRDQGRLEEAIAAYRQAIALRSQYPEALNNLSNALKDQGHLVEAIAACRQAIALNPTYAEAHSNLALLLLAQGDFPSGWKEHEWRWRCKEFASPRWDCAQPQWDGSELANRTILLHAEQGFGDALQFIRYLPMVVARAGKVIIQCAPELKRVLQGTQGVAQWLSSDDPLPPFDVHCPLSSLPLAFGTILESIPSSVPYVRTDAEAIEQWRQELAGDGHRLKVGLVWAGRPTHGNDRNRSISLAVLAPLAQVKNVSFHSLQKGEAGRQASSPPSGMELIDRTDELKDFADTAALMANLDLVISVDTAVAHLAGAMGKPVWTLLPFAPDWRWLLDRQDTPWYPTMRLFRQPAIGDWGSVIRRVAEALSKQLLGAARSG